MDPLSDGYSSDDQPNPVEKLEKYFQSDDSSERFVTNFHLSLLSVTCITTLVALATLIILYLSLFSLSFSHMYNDLSYGNHSCPCGRRVQCLVAMVIDLLL